LKKHKFRSIYTDLYDYKQLKLKASDYLNDETPLVGQPKELTIEEADSILATWGTSRLR